LFLPASTLIGASKAMRGQLGTTGICRSSSAMRAIAKSRKKNPLRRINDLFAPVISADNFVKLLQQGAGGRKA
jgi:hypothetical protein